MAGFGLKILRSNGPEGFMGNQAEFPIAANNSSPIFRGDLVSLASGLLVEATGAADNSDFSPLGVFTGCRYQDADGSYVFKPYWDGNSGRTNIVGIVSLPVGATFAIKGSSDGTYTQASVGSRFGIDYAVGSPAYGDSRCRLSAGAANSTGPLRLLRLVDTPYNGFDRPEPVFEVTFARSQGYATLA